LWLAAQVRSAEIVALCIGNDAYLRAEDVLDTPVADATLMKNTLEALPGGADVTLLTDASREDIQIALNSLVNRSRGAKLVLVFYSGHGLEGQPDGYPRPDTFLLPVEATIPDVTYLPTRAVGLQSVLEVLAKCPVTARAVILDCCRSGAPKATAALKGSTKSFGDIDQSVKDALGAAVVPEATLVAFASGPLRKAAAFLQQSDSNSPFTLFISESLATGTGNLRDLIEAAAERTEEATGMRQVPQVTYTGAASAIKKIVFRETAVPGNSAEMAALKAQLAAEQNARAEAERRAAMANDPAPATPDPLVVPSPVAPFPMAKTDPSPAPAFPASRGMEGSHAGEVREFGGIEMVWCPTGEFMMGSPASEADRSGVETQHRVILTKGFWLAKTECTQGQWQGITGDNPSQFKGDNLPVESVSWNAVQGYLAKMNSQNALPSGWKWALPSEAQWEYACRAGTTTAFAGDLDEMAWYAPNSGGKTNPVGTKKANAWGLHDMHGNVWEWCLDYYGDYASGSATDPIGATSGAGRVIRGGSWPFTADYCRAAIRNYRTPAFRDVNFGFRPALVPSNQ